MKTFLIHFGQLLYKYRAVTAVPFFIILVILSRNASFNFIPHLLLFLGLLIRIWAAGYIGVKARANRFATGYVITSGPYRYLKHPLYIGNLFLVLGVILLFNPPLWYAFSLLLIFTVEYFIIVYSELSYLKALPKKVVNFDLANARGEANTIIIVIVIALIRHFLR